jgi:hypothetical protein
LAPTGGNVLIGTTTDGGQKLQVNGTAYVSSDITSGSIIRSSGATNTIRVRGNSQYVDFTNLAENAYVNGTIIANTLSLFGDNGTGLSIGATGNATFAGAVTTKGSTLSAINNTNVSTTATDIAIATSVGGLYFVTGYNTSGGAQGTWLLMARGTNVTTISSDNNTGLTVTYSVSAGKLQAATASGTIALIATAITR